MSNNYVVLARKYRPANLLQLKAQDVVVSTISNAIMYNRLAHAYLLGGIRGIGKTTSARIIAKTINCEQHTVVDGVVIPCNQCKNCISFDKVNHPDIMEIDAASRTGVDDIRVIIENAEYRPLLAKYKVFIIDEVHMLSKNAFNALLKILEEPPAHVLFIFATTEVHKIPLTILSRCQRFELRRFSIDDIKSLLKEVCEQEGISCNEEALYLLASKSDGSARDALSLLDQASALSINSSDNNRAVTIEMVNEMCGVVDLSIIINLMYHIKDGDAPKALNIAAAEYARSADMSQFIYKILDMISYLAKKKSIDSYVLPEFMLYQADIERLLSNYDMSWLQIAWQLTNKVFEELKTSYDQLRVIEMYILKLMYSASMPSLRDLIDGFPRRS